MGAAKWADGWERGPLFTGHWSGEGVIDLALFVAVIALPQMTHTHTENEGSWISFDFLEFILFIFKTIYLADKCNLNDIEEF